MNNEEFQQRETRKDMTVLNSKMTGLEAAMTRTETRALFDAREVHEDKFDKVMEKLDSIEINTEYLVAKVNILGKIAK